MSELTDYLYRIISTNSYPIVFSGDYPNIINRWLVKAQDADHYEANNTEPMLRPEGRILARHELEFLSQEEKDSNWNYFISLDYQHYSCQYNTIQRDFKLDRDRYIYAVSTVWCKEEHESLIFCASTTPFSVWINGELVYTSNYDYFLKESTFVYNFKKGPNIVLVEKPYFLRHESLRINPDDFVFGIKPYDYLANQKENNFFDLNIFNYLKTTYRIVLNKAVYEENEKVEVLVLPRYFYGTGQVKKDVTIRVYNENNNLVTSIDTKTTTRVCLDLDLSYRGLLKIKAEVAGEDSFIIDNYILFGELVEYANQLFDRSRERKDCNEDIIYSLTQLVTIPNTKIGTIHDYYNMMCTYIYHLILEKLFEYVQYLKTSDHDTKIKPFDIFKYVAPIFNKTGIDDNSIATYIVLPKGYDSSKTYPVVIHFEHGYGMAEYPIIREYHRFRDFDDVILIDMCGRGGFNKDYINETFVYQIIEGLLKEYNIDRDRVYTIGACTGGMKSFSLAMRNPGLFAAAFGINGPIRTNIRNPDYEHLRNLESLTTGAIYCIEDVEFNCATLTETYSHVGNMKLWQVTSYSHEDFNEAMNSNRVVKEVLKYTRNRYPKKLHFTVYDPIYNHCHWAIVDQIADLSSKAVFDAEIVANNNIKITSCNIGKLSLLMNKEEMELEDDITIEVDGNKFEVNLMSLSRILLEWTKAGVALTQTELKKEEYFTRFNAIAVDESLMGIKKAYLKKCNFIYSDLFKEKKDGLTKRLIRLINLPLVERVKNYHYDKYSIDEIAPDDLAEHNMIYYTTVGDKSRLYDLLLQQTSCTISKDKLTFNGKTYEGDAFAVIKCKNPHNPEKVAILVAYNSDEVRQKMLEFWSTFDDNTMFYSDAIVYNQEKYYSFRNI